MGSSFKESDGRIIIDHLIETIHANRAYLSEIDGAIGDGDHGINMDKGFSMAEKELYGRDVGMSEAFKCLGRILVDEIGGSMGPLYGTFFKRMARASKETGNIDTRILYEMLKAAYEGIQSLGNAKVGDKTLVDTLDPAVSALKDAAGKEKNIAAAVEDMISAAEAGWKSTRDLVAKIGRASRLGERSRGVLDAGATSCYLMLKSIGDTVKELATSGD
ncbi:dihydroxyacetone kinase subunit DhaL [Marispirochaeta sp.]|jgi:phosphoenolpyruvate---glycerone phosphotransferase subunit DhaL|uniref:dihydroxyacetone kinase subunit DhaL n=1 Tax=Marispirochaeta sp. TaxID=2038653 RepID=UPI0029C80626|nr:dihydroxyacetone kinase subunit DhaL [Marispirochaeta sp.]